MKKLGNGVTEQVVAPVTLCKNHSCNKIFKRLIDKKSCTHCPRHWNLRRRNWLPKNPKSPLPKPNRLRLRLDPRLRPQVLSDSLDSSESPDPPDSSESSDSLETPDPSGSSDSSESPDPSDSSEAASVHYKNTFSISIFKSVLFTSKLSAINPKINKTDRKCFIFTLFCPNSNFHLVDFHHPFLYHNFDYIFFFFCSCENIIGTFLSNRCDG